MHTEIKVPQVFIQFCSPWSCGFSTAPTAALGGMILFKESVKHSFSQHVHGTIFVLFLKNKIRPFEYVLANQYFHDNNPD